MLLLWGLGALNNAFQLIVTERTKTKELKIDRVETLICHQNFTIKLAEK